MRRLVATCIALCVLLLASLGCHALDIKTPGGVLSIALPAGYTALSHDEIQKQFGRTGTLPLAVYGDVARRSTIAISWSVLDNPLADDDLPAFSNRLQDTLNQQIPHIKWLLTDMRNYNGKNWMHLDYVSPARDGHIHNATFGTNVGGNLLLVNFCALSPIFRDSAPAFIAAAKSLVVR